MFQKYSQILTVVAVIAFLFSAPLTAQTKKKTHDTKKTECSKKECSDSSKCSSNSKMKEASATKTWNKICPVTGDDVDPDVATVEYNGKTIGFCCKKCVSKFQKDPAKYLKHLSEDGAKFIKG